VKTVVFENQYRLRERWRLVHFGNMIAKADRNSSSERPIRRISGSLGISDKLKILKTKY